MDNLEPITREEMLLDGQDLEPITRKEMFIKRIYDKTQVVPKPITREEMFLNKAGEGGGGDITIEQLNVTENGTYSESGKAYSPVVVNVPTPPVPENAYLLNSLSGLPADIASFNDGTDLPMASLKVAVTPYQDLSHGDPSPSNICPIIGWDEAVVSVSGKNLFDYTKITAVSAGSIGDRNGTLFNKVGTYSVNAVNSGGYMYVRVFNSDGSIKSTYNVVVSTTITPATFTISSGEWFVVYDANPDTLDVSKGLFENWQVQVELSSQPTSYQPYNGATYTIDLNGTRYGGTLDVTSGTMTVDRVMVELSAVSFTYDAANKRWNRQFSDMRIYSERSADLMFEQYEPTISAYTGDTGTAFAYNNNIYIYDAEQSLTISGKCVYKLATPITVQLAPTPVKSIEGENNIFANCGQITEVKYFKKA